MDIREKAKNFLAESRWSQEQLADAINVHVTSLNRFINAQRRKSTGEKLAEFFETFERSKEKDDDKD